MAIEIVPTVSDPNIYVQRTALSGEDFILRFAYSSRECKWFFDLYDADNEPILLGAKVVINWPLLRLVDDYRRPIGELVAIDLPAQGEAPRAPHDPNAGDLGARVKVAYVTDD